MHHRGIAVATSTSTAALAGLAAGGAFFLLANRFVRELTRPGESIAEDSPVWGGWRFPQGDPFPPESLQRSLAFHASDGTRIAGEFWAQPHPAPTIVISHGFRLPRVKFRAVAALEYRHGCNILLFDYRGHGESAAIPTTGGIAEVSDLLAAVRVATLQPETLPGSVFIHGFSMGAAIALLLPPQPEVAGIIADSPYARLDEMLHRIIAFQLRAASARWPASAQPIRKLIPAVSKGLVAGAEVIVRLRFHHTLIARPEAHLHPHARRSGMTPPPILLIHATGDPLIPIAHSERIGTVARAAGIPVETYYVESNVHCGAYGTDPALYIEHLQAFLQRYQPKIAGA